MSAHTEIKAVYDRINERTLAKRQQGLAASDVPMTLQDAQQILKALLHLAEEVDAQVGVAGDHT